MLTIKQKTRQSMKLAISHLFFRCSDWGDKSHGHLMSLSTIISFVIMAVYFIVGQNITKTKPPSCWMSLIYFEDAHIPTKFGPIACDKMVEMWKDYRRGTMLTLVAMLNVGSATKEKSPAKEHCCQVWLSSLRREEDMLTKMGHMTL